MNLRTRKLTHARRCFTREKAIQIVGDVNSVETVSGEFHRWNIDYTAVEARYHSQSAGVFLFALSSNSLTLTVDKSPRMRCRPISPIHAQNCTKTTNPNERCNCLETSPMPDEQTSQCVPLKMCSSSLRHLFQEKQWLLEHTLSLAPMIVYLLNRWKSFQWSRALKRASNTLSWHLTHALQFLLSPSWHKSNTSRSDSQNFGLVPGTLVLAGSNIQILWTQHTLWRHLFAPGLWRSMKSYQLFQAGG